MAYYDKEVHYTPIGIASWPKLNYGKPDTNFDPDGKYQTDLILKGEDAAALMATLDGFLKRAWEYEYDRLDPKKQKTAFKTPPYTLLEDDDGDESGEVKFHFKLNAVGKSKKTGETWDNRVKLVDARGKKTAAPVGSGSKIRIAYSWFTYCMAVDTVGEDGRMTKNWRIGVSLRLIGVQIIELVEPGEAGLKFEPQEGGFDGSEYQEEAAAAEVQEEVAEENDEAVGEKVRGTSIDF